jgi:hypothetical protein
VELTATPEEKDTVVAMPDTALLQYAFTRERSRYSEVKKVSATFFFQGVTSVVSIVRIMR